MHYSFKERLPLICFTNKNSFDTERNPSLIRLLQLIPHPNFHQRMFSLKNLQAEARLIEVVDKDSKVAELVKA